jgi:hypothetical protein
MHSREPILHPVAISDLRPTQMTVGLREVAAKRREWRDKHGEHAAEFLGSHMIPVIKGPKERFYIIDHHHLSRALHEEGVESVLVTVVSDLSKLDKNTFWTVCDHRGWVYPYNAAGQRCGFDDIPKHVAKLGDDPYRSLAGELRRQGGFAKDTTPFSEFLWADFFRPRIKVKLVRDDFEKALSKAMILAKGKDAAYLPGWCGPVDH